MNYLKILRILQRNDVEHIVIGGVCAVAHGAPITTFDLDVLYEMSSENIDRLMGALAELEARHREPGDRRLAPQRSVLEAGGPALFISRWGPVDFLGDLAGRELADFAEDTVELELASGLELRLLSLEALIQVKEQTGRPKDLAVLPVLRETLRESKQQR